MYANDPTIAAELASVMAVAPDDVTHCVRVGTRDGGVAIYACGWWSQWAYHTAVVPHDGTRFGTPSITYDTGITH